MIYIQTYISAGVKNLEYTPTAGLTTDAYWFI